MTVVRKRKRGEPRTVTDDEYMYGFQDESQSVVVSPSGIQIIDQMCQEFSLTDEQRAILVAVDSGDDVLIEAGAGTGKTFTLRIVAHFLLKAYPRKWNTFVAFNVSVRDEAKTTFPMREGYGEGNTRAYTANGLVFGQLMRTEDRWFQGKLNAKVSPEHTVGWLGLRDMKLSVDSADKTTQTERTLSAKRQLSVLNKALMNFCNSLDAEPSERHFGFIEGIDGGQPGKNHQIVRRALTSKLAAMWDDLINPYETNVKFFHQCYVKLFHLHFLNAEANGQPVPKIGRDGDVLMFDEAQDANPVIADMLNYQTHLQRIYVGDQAQAIYGFAGAVDSMQNMRQAGGWTVCQLSTSWRFGQAVADAANLLLDELGSDLRLKGNPALTSEVIRSDANSSEFDCIIARNNIACLDMAVGARGKGRRVFLKADTQWIVKFLNAVEALMNSERPRMQELSVFADFDALRDYCDTEENDAPPEWKRMIRLIDKYQVRDLRAIVQSFEPTERTADLVITTAHKAKGLQWPRVCLMEDLNPAAITDREADDAGMVKRNREALMLAYVALTRAERVLSPAEVLVVEDRASGVKYPTIDAFRAAKAAALKQVVPPAEALEAPMAAAQYQEAESVEHETDDVLASPDKHTMPELRTCAREHGVSVSSRARRAELVDALIAYREQAYQAEVVSPADHLTDAADEKDAPVGVEHAENDKAPTLDAATSREDIRIDF